MRFLSIYKTVERSTPPTPEEMETMGRFCEEMFAAGHLLATEGGLPSALGARVRLDGGRPVVTDGPFTEAKELIAGFWLIQVKSKEEAIEWVKRVPFTEGEAEIEIRQVFEAEDFGPALTPELREQEERLRAEAAANAKR